MIAEGFHTGIARSEVCTFLTIRHQSHSNKNRFAVQLNVLLELISNLSLRFSSDVFTGF